jgi:hypothetical protein
MLTYPSRGKQDKSSKLMPFHAYVNLYTDTDGPKKSSHLKEVAQFPDFEPIVTIPFSKLSIKRAYNGEFLFKKTDVKKRGLASVDRNNKTTLLLTAPYSMTKSYAKGLSPRMVKLQDVS